MGLSWWQTVIPVPGDILWCRFPFDERTDQPAPTGHPSLVFEVRLPPHGAYSVLVAFGTSNLRSAAGTPNLVIQNLCTLNAAVLKRATLFDLGRSRHLPWDPTWFRPVGALPGPRLGVLDAAAREQLRHIPALRHARGLRVPVASQSMPPRRPSDPQDNRLRTGEGCQLRARPGCVQAESRLPARILLFSKTCRATSFPRKRNAHQFRFSILRV